MRILNEEDGNQIKSVLVMLTPSEAYELASSIDSLDPKAGGHIHVNDNEYKRQITVLIYTPDNQNYFSEKIRRIINELD